MPRKRKIDLLLGVSKPPVPSFGTGDVAEILGVPIWRIQSYLDRPSYRLKPEGQLGTGRGSRRVFSAEDVCRIAVAAQMVLDGFSTTFVGEILQQIDDRDFRPRHDDQGNELDVYELFGLLRTEKGARLCFYTRPPAFGQSDSPYYVFEFGKVVGEIDKRIFARKSRPT